VQSLGGKITAMVLYIVAVAVRSVEEQLAAVQQQIDSDEKFYHDLL
jgi:hypothetical protein